ncbi:MAG: hypothetical protein ACXAB7_17755 [Candidatus Kariarchaeaceae archaeon]|jgi:hypothetical protein
MSNNRLLFWIGVIFIGFGDIFWLGAVFLEDKITDFILFFSPSIEASDLTPDGLTVVRVMIGIIGTLMWLVGILLIPLSKQYTETSRNWIALGTIAWFIGDSFISLISEFETNAILNLLIAAPVLAVLYYTKPNLPDS